MPDWATGWAIYTFSLGLAFYCGIMTNKLSSMKESINEFKSDIKEEFKELHDEIEKLRRAIDTRKHQ